VLWERGGELEFFKEVYDFQGVLVGEVEVFFGEV